MKKVKKKKKQNSNYNQSPMMAWKTELDEKLNSIPFGEHLYEDDEGEVTVKKSRNKNINYRYRIDYEAKATTMSDKTYESEAQLNTSLDLGIENEMDTLNVDEGMIYGEAFKEAMNAFFDNYMHNKDSEMLKEATITLKKVEII